MRNIVSPLDGFLSPFGGLRFDLASSIRALFANSEPGVWYDPSDLSTLFQDDAGTTPVTTAGQTVALMLDKSQGLTLGPELVTNGTFDSDTDWTLGTGAVISDGVLSFPTGTDAAQQSVATTVGRFYSISYTMAGRTTGDLDIGLNSYVEGLNQTVNGEISFISKATGTQLNLRAQNGFDGNIDNISVKELPGYHATQATAAARPTYGYHPEGGVRNLLTRTEEFDNAVWLKSNTTVTANATTAPDGTMSADTGTDPGGSFSFIANAVTVPNDSLARTFSLYVKKDSNQSRFPAFQISYVGGTAVNIRCQLNTATGVTVVDLGSTSPSVTDEGDYWRVSFAAANNSTGNTSLSLRIYPAIASTLGGADAAATGSIIIWGAQLEEGSTATDYQRVGNEYDVTEAGVPSVHYLAFDGVDDFMVTPTITPGIDKVQVFAGVRKLSDAAIGAVLELSTSLTSNNGSLLLFAPQSANDFRFYSKGTTPRDAQGVFAAPTTRVATGIGDISGDLVTLRIDGNQVDQATEDQGTGNFLAYPMYIGARTGSSFFFNGNIYSLVTRFGANLETATIEQVETYTAGQTGVTLA